MKKQFIQAFLVFSLVIMASCSNKRFFDYSKSTDNQSNNIASFNSNTAFDSNSELGYSTHSKTFYHKWDTDSDGMIFSSEDLYIANELLNKVPLTFEATVELSKDCMERGGVIIGNYENGQNVINFEIYSNGNPRIYYCNRLGDVHDFVFNKININNGEKVHIALVDDFMLGQARCYINGKLQQSIENRTEKWLPSTKLMVGGDARYLNEQFFKGMIYNLALFDSIRDEEDINNDIVGIDINDSNLLVAYEMNSTCYQKNINSLNQTISIVYDAKWLKNVDLPKNYAYSFAVIGDTQIMNSKWPNNFHSIYDYVIDNRSSEKIAFCLGLGDITDNNTDSEWELARNNIDRMNKLVPYSLNRGNHDTSNSFNNYFGMQNAYYYSTIEGTYQDKKTENSYRTLNISNQKYLIFTLDYGIPDDVIDWAEIVIKQHPGYRTIITTHAFLFRDGTTLDQNDICPPASEPGLNNGDYIWDKFIKKYDIDLVLCGHDPVSDVVTVKTENDNDFGITQILVNPQGIDLDEPNGMIAMLYFSNDGDTVDIRYYSTVKKMWLRRSNQITIQIG